MLKSKFLRSGSNPVWVAAFCFTNLKKAQVLDTDIPSCVGKFFFLSFLLSLFNYSVG